MGVREVEEEIINLRVQNRHAATALQNIYTEIDGFMEEYYQKVGDLCMQISEIEEKQKKYKRKIRNEIDSPISVNESTQEPIGGYNQIRPRNDSSTDSMEKEAKALHRKLIKIIHPDVSEEKLKAAEYTRMVNEAYNQKNYTQLVKLDQLINSGNATERDLIKQRNNLIDATFDLKIQREQVVENPIYKLMLKFKSQTDGGNSMLGQIRKNLETKLAQEKRKFVDLKIEYLEKIQNKIIA